jgi:hypothetical protein
VTAGTLLHGEFDYDLDQQKLQTWQLGPIFPLGDRFELEIPVGQSDGQWQSKPELKYQVEAGKSTIDFVFGVEVPFQEESAQPFGRIEAEVGF